MVSMSRIYHSCHCHLHQYKVGDIQLLVSLHTTLSTSMSESPLNQNQSAEIIQSILPMIWQIIVFVTVIFLIYGIYLAVTLLVVYVLSSRGIRNSKPRLVLLVITVFELLVSTAYAVVALGAMSLHTLSAGNLDSEWAQHSTRLWQQAIAGMALVLRFNFLLSDGIVIWRTWVLFPFNTFVKSTLAFCLLVASVCTFVDGGISASRASYDDILHSMGGPITRNLLMSLPLLITNVLATASIGYKAWSHRKVVNQNLRSTRTTMSKALKTLWLMIESGLVYCIVLIAYIIIVETVPNSNDAFATFGASIFVSIMPLLAVRFQSFVLFNLS
ncbi:hypothetical protein K435DRAFT_33400 [Dendrothele bispora CBS 962.96]|uniref:Uncharacterized protein n=1 Tax=Dendrothele bispora (strain CBS 962.96) TaxID=1314807 RepID=A0A4V4HGC4_DENBC|nr:hypothetical protein K435DRAFT_33400 [Dendrothele bispora CBS 962.96]